MTVDQEPSGCQSVGGDPDSAAGTALKGLPRIFIYPFFSNSEALSLEVSQIIFCNVC